LISIENTWSFLIAYVKVLRAESMSDDLLEAWAISLPSQCNHQLAERLFNKIPDQTNVIIRRRFPSTSGRSAILSSSAAAVEASKYIQRFGMKTRTCLAMCRLFVNWKVSGGLG
jgi:hypothetical protein